VTKTSYALLLLPLIVAEDVGSLSCVHADRRADWQAELVVMQVHVHVSDDFALMPYIGSEVGESCVRALLVMVQ
jgi:hypothetical protein